VETGGSSSSNTQPSGAKEGKKYCQEQEQQMSRHCEEGRQAGRWGAPPTNSVQNYDKELLPSVTNDCKFATTQTRRRTEEEDERERERAQTRRRTEEDERERERERERESKGEVLRFLLLVA